MSSLPLSCRSLLAAVVALSLASIACARRHGSESTGSAVSGENPTNAASAAPNATVALGQSLYDRYCRLCHAADGSGYAADNAPSLVSKTFLESATDTFIAHGIRVGRPNTAMGAYGKERGGPLDEPSIAAIVAFLRAKGPQAVALPDQPPSGDPARGLEHFERECRSCHGSASQRGNALLLDNPELLASASNAFLRYAIRKGRPPTAMPAFEGKLAPAAIEDVLAYLRSLAPAGPASPKVVNNVVPDDLPVVINPKGKAPEFTLRDQRFVSSEQVQRALAQKRRLVIVDARSPADWIQFRIPGAISLPYHDHNQLERIPNDGTWVIAYCACPHHASGEVVDALRKRNYPNTAVLDEGILFWKDRGYPLEGEAVPKSAPSSSAASAAKVPPAKASAKRPVKPPAPQP
jgi:cytochrome c oxidase cbb3-type subunit III